MQGKCINCGSSTEIWMNFCKTCFEAKEAAYRKCEEDGITGWLETLQLRAKFLNDIRANKVA